MVEVAKMPAFILAGDSTMESYPADESPLTGWGQCLQGLAKPGIMICNHARGGRSSKSFRAEKRWAAVLEKLRPGDFALIQFGHNDGHTGAENSYRSTDPDGDFLEYMHCYISETRAAEAIPVLVTPTPKWIFENGRAVNTEKLERYIASIRRAAAETGTMLVDLNTALRREHDSLGEEKSLRLYLNLKPGECVNYPEGHSDTIHFCLSGARLAAQCFVAEFVKIHPQANKWFSKDYPPDYQEFREPTRTDIY